MRYKEDAHPPGLHIFEALKLRKELREKGARLDTAMPLVVLEPEEGGGGEGGGGRGAREEISGSAEIVKAFASEELYFSSSSDDGNEKNAEIDSLVSEFDDKLGVAVRCFAYHSLLSKEDPAEVSMLATACTDNTSHVESFLFKPYLTRGGGAGALKKFMKITDETALSAEEDIRAAFKRASRRLESEGGSEVYLIGGRFTAADLTLASLASPLLLPPERNMAGFHFSALPPKFQTLASELRATTAGKAVLETYARHRGTRAVVYKSNGRNRLPVKGIVGAVGAVLLANVFIF